jgi:hypothetical protein
VAAYAQGIRSRGVGKEATGMQSPLSLSGWFQVGWSADLRRWAGQVCPVSTPGELS